MSQHDMNLANADGATFRADANSALGALASNSSGATEPSTTVAYQWWADTTTGWLKQRNAANSAWIKRTPLGTGAAADIASATTLDLTSNSASSGVIRVTGTTTTTAITLEDGQIRLLRAAGAWPITHGASLVCPGSTSYTCAAGDLIMAIGEATSVVRLMIWKADGTAVVGGSATQPVVGVARNVKCSITTASATATFTADEVICKTAVGGTAYLAASLSQSVNLGTTGAGGMDTGSAPASGFVSIYAIMKADGTKSVMACNVTTSSTEVYGGANYPSGYVASALLGVLPTNGSSQFLPLLLRGRKVYLQARQNALNVTASAATSYTSVSISSIVPSVAKTVDGLMGDPSTGNVPRFSIAADSSGLGQRTIYLSSNTTSIDSFYQVVPFNDLPLITAQTFYYKSLGASDWARVDITAYEI